MIGNWDIFPPQSTILHPSTMRYLVMSALIVAASPCLTVAQITYATQIQPILTNNCAGCHAGGSLDFSTYESVMASTSSSYGRAIVQPGNPNFSPLYDKLLPNPQFGSRMPLGGSLTAAQIELIRTWISEGATSLDRDDLPEGVDLLQNYPNPFNPTTVISWRLAEAGMVKVTVHDLAGREVAVLADRMMSAGTHQVSFDASNLASGIYLYRLRTAEVSLTRKMVLMR